MKIFINLVLLLSASILSAQPTPSPLARIVPDCVFTFDFTAAGSTSPYVNVPPGAGAGQPICTTFALSYAAVGFSTLSLTFQSANASGNATTPGTWGTYGGTVTTGINPNTSITGAQTFFSNLAVAAPFVRVNLSGLTGTGRVWGQVYGYKSGYLGANAVGLGCPSGGVAANGQVVINKNGVCGGTNDLTYDLTPGSGYFSYAPTVTSQSNPFNITPTMNLVGNSWSAEVLAVVPRVNLSQDSTAAIISASFIGGILTSPSFNLGTSISMEVAGIGTVGSTVTDNIAIYVDDMASGPGTNKYALFTGAGLIRLGDKIYQPGIAFSALGTSSSGTQIYCTDCTVTSSIDDTCVASGTGASAFRIAGVWRCRI